MNKHMLLALFLLLAGCQSLSHREADNRTWTPVSCSTYMEFNLCQDEAKKICPNGYDVANVTYSRGEQLRRMDVACKP
ncbi:MAG TPA: hypothetical protein VFX01_06495 [Methylophilaceae bacterium]|nr:hypothetical protein [Methylophilaceae bacterium]